MIKQISMRVQWRLSHLMLYHQRGSEVDLCMKICSNNAGDLQTRRSRTKFMVHTWACDQLISILWIGLQWKHQYLTLLPWKSVWKSCMPSNISWECWAFQYHELHIFMEITCCLSIIPQKQSQHLKRSVMQSLMMPSMSLWQWENHWQCIKDHVSIQEIY